MSYPGKPSCSDAGTPWRMHPPRRSKDIGLSSLPRPCIENRTANGEPGAGREQRVADPWAVRAWQHAFPAG